MIPISDGNSAIGAEQKCEIGNLICLRHLDRQQSQMFNFFFNKVFLYTCTTSTDLLKYHGESYKEITETME